MANIAIIGDGGVGKTVFMNKLRTGKFSPKYIPTAGFTSARFSVGTKSRVVRFRFHDFGGQEKFNLTPTSYKDIDAVLLFFDVTSKLTFRNVDLWVRTINKSIPIILCGNKTDVRNRKVTAAEALTKAAELNLRYIEMNNKDSSIVEPLRELCHCLTSSFVQNLSEICRLKIRRCIGTNQQMDDLELPKVLVRFIQEYTDGDSEFFINTFI